MDTVDLCPMYPSSGVVDATCIASDGPTHRRVDAMEDLQREIMEDLFAEIYRELGELGGRYVPVASDAVAPRGADGEIPGAGW